MRKRDKYDNDDSKEFNSDQVKSESEKDDNHHAKELMDEELQTEYGNSDYEELYL